MKKSIVTTLTLGSAIAFGSALTHAENPFSAKPLTQGYQLASAEKHTEAKCGANKKEDAKCGADKKEEAKCGAEGKKDEAKCGAESKKKDGKCGEGKCGGSAK